MTSGTDAVRYAAAADEARIESDARWRALNESTDRDDATAGPEGPARRSAGMNAAGVGGSGVWLTC